MKLTKQTEAAALEAYLSFWEANLSADMVKFASYLVDDFSIFGSANGEEFFSKQDAVAFYTATADEMRGKAQLRNRNISVQPADENSVVVREQSQLFVLIDNNWTFYGHARISCVIRYINNTWMAVHQHASFPDHRTEPGQQLAAQKIQNENLELREAVQRRTVELQQKNRELEIEAAVERVRAQSMAMQQTSDIAKVNEALYQQLTLLQIKNFTGVAIYLVDEEEMVTVWDLSSPGSMGDVSNYAFKYNPKLTPTLSEFIPIWKAAEQEYFVMDFPKEKLLTAANELEPFYPAMAENFRNAVSSGTLEHQWNATAIFSQGILSLDLTKPPTEEVKTITLKMAAAFNLAYQRFHDLRKAETQTKAARIEAALERVRSRSMAMHHSNEFPETAAVLYQQLKELGIDLWACGFGIWDEKNPSLLRNWMNNGVEAGFITPILLPFREDAGYSAIYEASLKGETFLEQYVEGEELKKHYNWLIAQPSAKLVFEKLKQSGLTPPPLQYKYAAFFKGGFLILIAAETKPDIREIAERFAIVFEQTYTRFLDLQKAEAQTREAQIETALERVRSRTMAMQHSDELAEASFVLDSQIRSLGIKTRGCAFNIYGDNESTEWFSSEIGIMPPYKTPREKLFLRYYEAGQAGEIMHIEKIEDNECKAHYEYLCTLPVMGDALKEMIAKGGSFPVRQTDHVVYFKYGYLLFITLNPVPESHDIFIRFTKVFEQTYTRFLDLQKAEAQALRAEQDLLAIKEAKQKAEEALVELQITQKQLIQSEKMASLGELTAGIAHEIQNPLNFVNNFSEVSKELLDEMKEAIDKGDTEEAREIMYDVIQNLEKINHHGKRADGIVKGMLQHSRSSSGAKEPTDINVLADEYLRLAFHGLRAKDKSFNATLTTDYDESIGKINLIPQDIGRVILNLITNAFYVVAEKKKSGIAHYEPTVSISTKKVADKIEIKIKDNGTGIPQTILDKIFQPFFTTKPTGQGTGLGLSLAYDIVKAHGGEMKVQTKEAGPADRIGQSEGSTFVIILPIL